MELYLPPILPKPKNGRFVKGSIPHNKGKKWSDYMDMRKGKRVIRRNLTNRGNPNLPGANRKAVVMIKDNRLIAVFSSAMKASETTNLIRENISKCCRKLRRSHGGYKWFYETDFENWKKEIQNE